MDFSNIKINEQSSIRIAGEKVIYFDPFNVTDEAHDADIIFVSHEHHDHFDPASIEKIKKDGTILVAPETCKDKVTADAGISASNLVFVAPGEETEIGGSKVSVVPSYNVMKPFHMKMKKWVGYIVTMDGVKYYAAGDTDVNEDIKKVQCDVALLPIGGHYTMDYKQAVSLLQDIQPKAVIPTHFGTIIGGTDLGEKFKAMVNEAYPEMEVALVLKF